MEWVFHAESSSTLALPGGMDVFLTFSAIKHTKRPCVCVCVCVCVCARARCQVT
jgi:hypothetical protein